jgi:hypothetical protein
MVAAEDIGRQILTYGERYGLVDFSFLSSLSWDALGTFA